MALLAAPGLNTIGQLWFHCLQIVNKQPAPEDLRVFTVVARKSGFAAAAEVLGASPAYVSKRIRLLEQELGVKLLHRTTRRVAVTEEGERVFHWAQRILDDMDQLMQEVAITRSEPRGLLRVSSSFGFGRHVIAPALSRRVDLGGLRQWTGFLARCLLAAGLCGAADPGGAASQRGPERQDDERQASRVRDASLVQH